MHTVKKLVWGICVVIEVTENFLSMQSLPITTIIVGNTNIDLCSENIQGSGGIEYEAVLNSFLTSIMRWVYLQWFVIQEAALLTTYIKT